MGYSKNKEKVERVRKLLDQMLGTSVDLRWESDNPHMLAYHLREAMTIAQKNHIEPYEELKDKFTIRNRGTFVLAEVKKSLDIVAQLQTAMAKVVLEDETTVVAIVGAAITHKAEELFFPNAVLSEDDLKQLYTWTEKNGYFIVAADLGATLTKRDPGPAKWSPDA